jgi:hypothetical protein
MATFAINETARREQYVSTGQATYNFNFQVNVTDELLVYVNDTAQTLSVQYNATLNADGTGSITFIDNSGGGGTNYTPSSGDLITIIGDLALSRTTTLNTAGDITTTNLDTEFDNTVIRQQQIKEITDRALQLKPSTPRTVTGSGTSGPIYFPYDATPSNNASRVISYDSNGTGLELGPTTTNLETLATIVSDISTVAGISSEIQTVAADGSDIGIVATNINSVNVVATNINDVIKVADDLNEAVSEVETVANDLNEAVSEIDTVGTNIGVIQTVGDSTNIANITTVAGQISPTNNISTVAGLNTEITTVSNANANITTIATNLNGSNTIGTVATDLSGSNTIGTVATNITNVQDVAANISGVNSFAERYRVAASDPTTSLDQGDLAFNTSGSVLKYYDGSSWQTVTAGGISDVVQDSSPELGGDLDVAGQSIVSVSNGDIPITPDGTGKVIIDGLSYPTSDGVVGQAIVTDGSGNLSFGTTSSPEVYGFELVDTDADGVVDTLRVTTTDEGNDNISSAAYANFDDVIYGASGMTWSLTSDGDLRVTI